VSYTSKFIRTLAKGLAVFSGVHRGQRQARESLRDGRLWTSSSPAFVRASAGGARVREV